MPRLTVLGFALLASASVFVQAAPAPAPAPDILGGLLGPLLGGKKERERDRDSHRHYNTYSACPDHADDYDKKCDDEITKRSTISDKGNVDKQDVDDHVTLAAAQFKDVVDNDVDVDNDNDIDDDSSDNRERDALTKRANIPGFHGVKHDEFYGGRGFPPAASVPYGQLKKSEYYDKLYDAIIDDITKRSTPVDDDAAAFYYDKLGEQYKQVAQVKALQDKLDDWATKRSTESQ